MKRLLIPISLAIAFGISYTQAPLYVAHYYLFFGLSKAGFGFLSRDWLASSVDPFPIFSTIVRYTYKFAHPIFFQIYPLVLLGIYAFSMIEIIFEIFPRIRACRTLRWIFIAAFIFLHSKLFYDLTFRMGRVVIRGVANYYLLGPSFQPSMFGVFLILSILVFIKEKARTATLIAALLTAMHPTYFLVAGCLTAAYMMSEYQKTKSLREPIVLGLIGASIALPVALWIRFIILKPTSPEIMAAAQNILVHFRDPHHMVPSRWIMNTLLRIPYVLVAMSIIRKTKLFMPMLVMIIVAITLSGLQMITNSNALALISPWRISVLLVPLSTIIFVAWVISRLQLAGKYFIATGMLIIAISTAYGAYAMTTNKPYSDKFADLRAFIAASTESGDTYLIPPLDKTFQHFRLSTGAPIYANFKLHPFRDADIIEWYERVRKAQSFYKADNAEACRMLSEFPITKVITLSEITGCRKLTEIFNNGTFHIYAL